ncbi:MAG: hypothetical protein GX154_08975 [Clostridiales bacterium]|nr:hypothetical protein [Clostridiales bacterium]
MISLVRKSTKYLIIETNDLKEMDSYLQQSFDAFKSNVHTVSAQSNEDYTVLYLTDDIKKPSIISVKSCVYLISLDLDSILCRIINEKTYNLIKTVKIAPRFIIFRTFGDIDKIIYSILKDYDGKVSDMIETAYNLDLDCSLIGFTDKPLNRNLGLEDFYDKCLQIDYNTKSLYRNLKMNALRYLNEGLVNKNWYEMEIRIYDIYNAYPFHYRRLMHIIEHLELGIVLGESWTKDYPFVLMPVGVYSLKFFTFFKPEYIKSIMMGLEHTNDGIRLCDLDVYYSRKKLSWREFAKDKSATKEGVRQGFRKKLIDMLSPESARYILEIENETIKSRK